MKVKAGAMDLRPMLATTWEKDSGKACFPMRAQAKLDGIRGVFWQGSFVSRTLKPIAEASTIRAELAECLPFPYPLDGELFKHNTNFSEIVRAVHADDASLEYVVYDCMAPAETSLGFSDREALLEVWFAKHKKILKHVKLLSSRLVHTKADVAAAHDQCVKDGYEGVILRSPGALYEHKRSRNLIKLKSFQDAEYEVVGYKASAVGTVVWKCRIPTGRTFFVRPRGTNVDAAAALRSASTRIGQKLTVSFQELSADGIPRFPVALHFRPQADIDSVIDRKQVLSQSTPFVSKSRGPRGRTKLQSQSQSTAIAPSRSRSRSRSLTKTEANIRSKSRSRSRSRTQTKSLKGGMFSAMHMATATATATPSSAPYMGSMKKSIAWLHSFAESALSKPCTPEAGFEARMHILRTVLARPRHAAIALAQGLADVAALRDTASNLHIEYVYSAATLRETSEAPPAAATATAFEVDEVSLANVIAVKGTEHITQDDLRAFVIDIVREYDLHVFQGRLLCADEIALSADALTTDDRSRMSFTPTSKADGLSGIYHIGRVSSVLRDFAVFSRSVSRAYESATPASTVTERETERKTGLGDSMRERLVFAKRLRERLLNLPVRICHLVEHEISHSLLRKYRGRPEPIREIRDSHRKNEYIHHGKDFYSLMEAWTAQPLANSALPMTLDIDWSDLREELRGDPKYLDVMIFRDVAADFTQNPYPVHVAVRNKQAVLAGDSVPESESERDDSDEDEDDDDTGDEDESVGAGRKRKRGRDDADADADADEEGVGKDALEHVDWDDIFFLGGVEYTSDYFLALKEAQAARIASPRDNGRRIRFAMSPESSESGVPPYRFASNQDAELFDEIAALMQQMTVAAVSFLQGVIQ